MKLIEIEEGDDFYLQAVDLRYRLFFEEHGLPKSVVFDEHEKHSAHFGLHTASKLVAYGRLTPFKDGESLISQMVVDTDFQSQGYGSQLLAELMKIGVIRGASKFALSSRIKATKLYLKFGFSIAGSVYNSSSTGVPHVKMVNHANT